MCCGFGRFNHATPLLAQKNVHPFYDARCDSHAFHVPCLVLSCFATASNYHFISDAWQCHRGLCMFQTWQSLLPPTKKHLFECGLLFGMRATHASDKKFNVLQRGQRQPTLYFRVPLTATESRACSLPSDQNSLPAQVWRKETPFCRPKHLGCPPKTRTPKVKAEPAKHVARFQICLGFCACFVCTRSVSVFFRKAIAFAS